MDPPPPATFAFFVFFFVLSQFQSSPRKAVDLPLASLHKLETEATIFPLPTATKKAKSEKRARRPLGSLVPLPPPPLQEKM